MGERVELGPGCKVVSRRGVEDEIGQAKEGSESGFVVDLAEPGLRDEQGGHEARDQQAGNQGGGDAHDAPGIKLAAQRREAQVAPHLQDGVADHEARDDEEHVHANKPSGQQAGVEVVEKHRCDGDGPQSVDGGDVTLWRRFRGVGHVGHRIDLSPFAECALLW